MGRRLQRLEKTWRPTSVIGVSWIYSPGLLRIYSVLFGYARALVRLAEENEKPDAKRLPEYTDARRAALEGESVFNCSYL